MTMVIKVTIVREVNKHFSFLDEIIYSVNVKTMVIRKVVGINYWKIKAYFQKSLEKMDGLIGRVASVVSWSVCVVIEVFLILFVWPRPISMV